MEDLRPNSHKSKEQQLTKPEERKKLEKVVTGDVKVKKKNEIRKFTDVFISEDVSSVKSYIWMDVLVPSIKKAISEVITNGIDMLLYGGTRKDRNSRADRVSYRSYYDRRDDERRYSDSYRNRVEYSQGDIILPSRGEAEKVLSLMDELVENYGMASIADLNDLVGISGEYTDNRYGWTDLRRAEVVRVRDGYLLRMPKSGPLPR